MHLTLYLAEQLKSTILQAALELLLCTGQYRSTRLRKHGLCPPRVHCLVEKKRYIVKSQLKADYKDCGSQEDRRNVKLQKSLEEVGLRRDGLISVGIEIAREETRRALQREGRSWTRTQEVPSDGECLGG